MEAIYIIPQMIGVSSEYSDEWVEFVAHFGYDKNSVPNSILVTEIKITK